MHFIVCAQCDVIMKSRVCLHQGYVQYVVTDKEIKQQCTRLRLRACVKAKDSHFELKLQILVPNDCLHNCF